MKIGFHILLFSLWILTEVVSPNRANPNDAGLDFYVPTNLTSEDIHCLLYTSDKVYSGVLDSMMKSSKDNPSAIKEKYEKKSGDR